MIQCNQTKIYYDFTVFENQKWSDEKVLTFNIPIQDTLNGHNIFINLRNTGHYPFQNIFFFVSYTSPTGQTLTDTVEYILAEPSGKWLGNPFHSDARRCC